MATNSDLILIPIQRSVKVRLYPNQTQLQQLAQTAGCCRFVYNWGLARWKELYTLGENTSGYLLSNELTQLKKSHEYTWLNDAIAQSLQQAIVDLHTAYQRFFRHVKISPKNAGYPQFHKKGIRDSFRVVQYFQVLFDDNHLLLPKVGLVKCKGLRKMPGVVKNITVVKEADGWYACLCYIYNSTKKENHNTTFVGIDVGIKNLLTVANGSQCVVYQHHPHLKSAYERLAVLQKQASHKSLGSRNRHKANQRVARQHQYIANLRKDTLHKVSRELCKNHAHIGVEDLKILNMSASAAGTLAQPGRNVAQKRGLNRSIRQQGWGIFFTMLRYKAQETGSVIDIFNAAYTSQTCPCCGFISKDNRMTQSLFKCVVCGHTDNADSVAAINIRAKLSIAYGLK